MGQLLMKIRTRLMERHQLTSTSSTDVNTKQNTTHQGTTATATSSQSLTQRDGFHGYQQTPLDRKTAVHQHMNTGCPISDLPSSTKPMVKESTLDNIDRESAE